MGQCSVILRQPPMTQLFPYTTLFRSDRRRRARRRLLLRDRAREGQGDARDVHRRGMRNAPARLLVLHELDRVEVAGRSEEHTSELQSLRHLVCRLLLEKKRTITSLSQ